MPQRISKTIWLLEKELGTESWNWHTQQTPFQILIGIVLSQRTRDENTDKAAKRLFSRYPDSEILSRAKVKDIEKLIRPSGFYRQKAKRIREIAKIISEGYGGEVPKTMEELIKLPGVGRKTASCTLLYGHNISCIPCDVHVMVIAQRLGWTNKKNPDDIQKDLERKIPKKYWNRINELFVKHGQITCLTRRPLCYKCPVVKLCNYKEKNLVSL